LVITVGNPKSFTADIQIAVHSGCPGWLAWTEPDILRDVPAGGVRNVTLKVVPPAAGATLGSGCYIDVETYINGELISGIRKVDLPPVHPPVGEPPYAEREITIRPDPPVVGQPAQICATLHNYAGVDQTVDVILYAMDFGMGLLPQEVGRLSGLVIPANTTIERCITWTPPPGSEHRCLQIRIQQAGYNDIISQRNIANVRLPGIVHLPLSYDFKVGNTAGQTKTVQLNTDEIGLAAGWSVSLDFTEVTLGPGETVTNTMHIRSLSQASTVMQVDEEVLPGDAHLVAVEAFVDDELIGGVLFEFEAEVRKIYLPVIMKKWTIWVPDTPTPTPTNTPTATPGTTVWEIQNDTGGTLTINLQDVGTRSFGTGVSEWTVPCGTHTYTATASCGSTTNTRDFPCGGSLSIRFYCGSASGPLSITD